MTDDLDGDEGLAGADHVHPYPDPVKLEMNARYGKDMVNAGIEVLTGIYGRLSRIEQVITGTAYEGKHVFLLTSGDIGAERINIHGIAHDADTARGLHSHICPSLVEWQGLLEARCDAGHLIEAWYVR